MWYPSTISVLCHTQRLFLCCMLAFPVFFFVLSVGLFCNLFSDSAVGCFLVELLYECSCFVFII